MKKVVAIDFDGTLADSFGLINKSIIGACMELGVHLEENDLKKYWGASEDGIFVNILGKEKGPEGFKKYLEIYEKYHDDYLSVTPNIEDLLKKLQEEGVALAYLTGRSMESSLISLKKLGLLSYFSRFYYGSPKGINKELNLVKLCGDYSVDPSEVVYIGDSVADVVSCKKANVDILSVTFNHTYSFERLNKANPGNVFDSVDKLSERLLSLV